MASETGVLATKADQHRQKPQDSACSATPDWKASWAVVAIGKHQSGIPRTHLLRWGSLRSIVTHVELWSRPVHQWVQRQSTPGRSTGRPQGAMRAACESGRTTSKCGEHPTLTWASAHCALQVLQGQPPLVKQARGKQPALLRPSFAWAPPSLSHKAAGTGRAQLAAQVKSRRGNATVLVLISKTYCRVFIY